MGQTLSKSRFVQGLGCPKKLVYGAEKSYLNRSDEDTFLASLAQGGFQVGEFAKAHFPGGSHVNALDQYEALAQTNELLQRKSAIIYEAAIQFENCLVRVDVLEKKADRLIIHEVKAKSYDPTDDYFFVGKVGYWDGFKTFVSPSPHKFGANVFENASSGFTLWYGQIEFPYLERVCMSFGAFEVKQYFPLTRRIHLQHQFYGFESIAKSMGRAGYAAHSWHALQQWEYHSAMNHCLSNMSEEWGHLISHLDDRDLAELQRERSKKAA